MIDKVRRDPVSPKMLAVRGEDVMRIAKIEPSSKSARFWRHSSKKYLKNRRKIRKNHLEARITELAKLSDKKLAELKESSKERKKRSLRKKRKKRLKRNITYNKDMLIKIKRFDKTLPLPEYKTEGAAAFDLYAREATEIPPGAIRYVPLNIAVETPPGHFLLLAPRSSTHKRGL